MRVTVALPYFQCQPYIRQAVESVLAQTYCDLILVVINDGDLEPPWDELAHIDDPRLVRFDLPMNRGLYFVNAVALNATPDAYFATQDADDWSEPQRIARLLEALQRENAVCAVSGGVRHTTENGIQTATPYDGFPQRNQPLIGKFYHRATHQGLYRTQTLRAIGGYYAGVRIAYDMLLTNLVQMTGHVAYVDAPLYHRRIRPASLTTASPTGFGSPARVKTVEALRHLYQQAFALYTASEAGKISVDRMLRAIRELCLSQTPTAHLDALAHDSQSLCKILA